MEEKINETPPSVREMGTAGVPGDAGLSYLLEQVAKYRELAEKYKVKRSKSQYNYYHYAHYTGKAEACEEIVAALYGEKYV